MHEISKRIQIEKKMMQSTLWGRREVEAGPTSGLCTSSPPSSSQAQSPAKQGWTNEVILHAQHLGCYCVEKALLAWSAGLRLSMIFCFTWVVMEKTLAQLGFQFCPNFQRISRLIPREPLSQQWSAGLDSARERESETRWHWRAPICCPPVPPNLKLCKKYYLIACWSYPDI